MVTNRLSGGLVVGALITINIGGLTQAATGIVPATSYTLNFNGTQPLTYLKGGDLVTETITLFSGTTEVLIPFDETAGPTLSNVLWGQAPSGGMRYAHPGGHVYFGGNCKITFTAYDPAGIKTASTQATFTPGPLNVADSVTASGSTYTDVFDTAAFPSGQYAPQIQVFNNVAGHSYNNTSALTGGDGVLFTAFPDSERVVEIANVVGISSSMQTHIVNVPPSFLRTVTSVGQSAGWHTGNPYHTGDIPSSASVTHTVDCTLSFVQSALATVEGSITVNGINLTRTGVAEVTIHCPNAPAVPDSSATYERSYHVTCHVLDIVGNGASGATYHYGDT